jgi:hypothetical protein
MIDPAGHARAELRLARIPFPHGDCRITLAHGTGRRGDDPDARLLKRSGCPLEQSAFSSNENPVRQIVKRLDIARLRAGNRPYVVRFTAVEQHAIREKQDPSGIRPEILNLVQGGRFHVAVRRRVYWFDNQLSGAVPDSEQTIRCGDKRAVIQGKDITDEAKIASRQALRLPRIVDHVDFVAVGVNEHFVVSVNEQPLLGFDEAVDDADGAIHRRGGARRAVHQEQPVVCPNQHLTIVGHMDVR